MSLPGVAYADLPETATERLLAALGPGLTGLLVTALSENLIGPKRSR